MPTVSNPFARKRSRLRAAQRMLRQRLNPSPIRRKLKAIGRKIPRKKPRVIGEGWTAKVLAKSPVTVRKQFKAVNILYAPQRIFNGKGAAQKESEIQRVVAKKGLAPKVKKVGKNYIDMGRVYGQTIDKRMKGGYSSDSIQRRNGRRLARSLKKVHDVGVQHRDLHGQNVVIGPLGGVKIIDYGSAKKKNRPLKSGERRKDYKKVLRTHKGKKYKAFRDSFEKNYAP